MKKVRVEMLVPDDLDPSTILEKMQEQAVEWLEEAIGDDDEELPQGVTTLVENEVSVQDVCDHPSYHTAGLVDGKQCTSCKDIFL